MSPRIILFVFAVALTGHGRTVAQDSPLNEVYGAGVHAFYDGHHSEAIDALTAAIDGGMKDARAYYFRGLAQAGMGDLEAAKADFELGATLEAADPAMSTVVSRSLQRIQGQVRLCLEVHRTKARLAALSERRARDEALYGREQAEERRTLTKQADKAATEEMPIEKPAPADATKVEETEEKATEKKPAKEPTDPFGDEAPKTDPKAEPADPFGEQPKAKEAPAAEEAPAVKEEEMPAEEAPAVKKPAEKKA
jgi:hypothetical protein